jgi:hypothetical protein
MVKAGRTPCNTDAIANHPYQGRSHEPYLLETMTPKKNPITPKAQPHQQLAITRRAFVSGSVKVAE